MTRNRNFKSALIFLFGGLLFVVLTKCKKKEEQEMQPNSGVEQSFNQEEMLQEMADNVIIPAYKNYKAKTFELKTAIDAFVAGATDANLASTKTAFESAYMAWQGVLLYEFGPAADATLSAQTNIYPTDGQEVNRSIANADFNLNPASKADEKGFPAIDYLLYGKSQKQILLDFTSDSLSSNRKKYLQTVVDEIATNAEQLQASWVSSYKSSFVGNTGSGSGSSMALLINAINQQYERYIRDGKLGIPLGVRSFNGSVLVDHVESRYATHLSLMLLKESLLALDVALKGGAGMGIDDYLTSLGAHYNDGSLNAGLQSQIANCIQQVEKVDGNLADALVNQKLQVEAFYKELQKLSVLLKVDVPSALGVVISYQDNDGD